MSSTLFDGTLAPPAIAPAAPRRPAGHEGAAGSTEPASAPPALELQGIDLSFGGVHALRGIDLRVAPGELRAIIGPNGAGKSSLVNIISGLYRADAGRVRIGGESFAQVPTPRLAHLGVARTFQNLALFKGLSVRDNIALGLAARHVDAYLTWGEPPAAVAAKIADVRHRAAAQGRDLDRHPLRFGVRLHVIVRETSEEAWADADRLISRLTDDDIARAQQNYARMDSHGQQRMAALHGGRRDRLVVGPNLWAGVGLVRGGAGTSLVGNAQEVAERLQEYVDVGVGVDSFVLSGYPHLEEAIRFAELVFPLLPGKQAVTLRDQSLTGGAFDVRASRPAAAELAIVHAPVPEAVR